MEHQIIFLCDVLHHRYGMGCEFFFADVVDNIFRSKFNRNLFLHNIPCTYTRFGLRLYTFNDICQKYIELICCPPAPLYGPSVYDVFVRDLYHGHVSKSTQKRNIIELEEKNRLPISREEKNEFDKLTYLISLLMSVIQERVHYREAVEISDTYYCECLEMCCMSDRAVILNIEEMEFQILNDTAEKIILLLQYCGAIRKSVENEEYRARVQLAFEMDDSHMKCIENCYMIERFTILCIEAIEFSNLNPIKYYANKFSNDREDMELFCMVERCEIWRDEESKFEQLCIFMKSVVSLTLDCNKIRKRVEYDEICNFQRIQTIEPIFRDYWERESYENSEIGRMSNLGKIKCNAEREFAKITQQLPAHFVESMLADRFDIQSSELDEFELMFKCIRANTNYKLITLLGQWKRMRLSIVQDESREFDTIVCYYEYFGQEKKRLDSQYIAERTKIVNAEKVEFNEILFLRDAWLREINIFMMVLMTEREEIKHTEKTEFIFLVKLANSNKLCIESMRKFIDKRFAEIYFAERYRREKLEFEYGYNMLCIEEYIDFVRIHLRTERDLKYQLLVLISKKMKHHNVLAREETMEFDKIVIFERKCRHMVIIWTNTICQEQRDRMRLESEYENMVICMEEHFECETKIKKHSSFGIIGMHKSYAVFRNKIMLLSECGANMDLIVAEEHKQYSDIMRIANAHYVQILMPQYMHKRKMILLDEQKQCAQCLWQCCSHLYNKILSNEHDEFCKLVTVYNSLEHLHLCGWYNIWREEKCELAQIIELHYMLAREQIMTNERNMFGGSLQYFHGTCKILFDEKCEFAGLIFNHYMFERVLILQAETKEFGELTNSCDSLIYMCFCGMFAIFDAACSECEKKGFHVFKCSISEHNERTKLVTMESHEFVVLQQFEQTTCENRCRYSIEHNERIEFSTIVCKQKLQDTTKMRQYVWKLTHKDYHYRLLSSDMDGCVGCGSMLYPMEHPDVRIFASVLHIFIDKKSIENPTGIDGIWLDGGSFSPLRVEREILSRSVFVAPLCESKIELPTALQVTHFNHRTITMPFVKPVMDTLLLGTIDRLSIKRYNRHAAMCVPNDIAKYVQNDAEIYLVCGTRVVCGKICFVDENRNWFINDVPTQPGYSGGLYICKADADDAKLTGKTYVAIGLHFGSAIYEHTYEAGSEHKCNAIKRHGVGLSLKLNSGIDYCVDDTILYCKSPVEYNCTIQLPTMISIVNDVNGPQFDIWDELIYFYKKYVNAGMTGLRSDYTQFHFDVELSQLADLLLCTEQQYCIPQQWFEIFYRLTNALSRFQHHAGNFFDKQHIVEVRQKIFHKFIGPYSAQSQTNSAQSTLSPTTNTIFSVCMTMALRVFAFTYNSFRISCTTRHNINITFSLDKLLAGHYYGELFIKHVEEFYPDIKTTSVAFSKIANKFRECYPYRPLHFIVDMRDENERLLRNQNDQRVADVIRDLKNAFDAQFEILHNTTIDFSKFVRQSVINGHNISIANSHHQQSTTRNIQKFEPIYIPTTPTTPDIPIVCECTKYANKIILRVDMSISHTYQNVTNIVPCNILKLTIPIEES